MTRIPRTMTEEEISDWGLRLFEWYYEYGDGGDYNQVVEDFNEEFGIWEESEGYDEDDSETWDDLLWDKIYNNCAERADAARRHKTW